MNKLDSYIIFSQSTL